MADDRPKSDPQLHKSIEQLCNENKLLLIELAALDAETDEVKKLHEEWLKLYLIVVGPVPETPLTDGAKEDADRSA